MATPTEILANNAGHPPAEWLPEYLRALAKMEQRAYYERERAKMEAFLALMERFEDGMSSYFRDPEMGFEPLPPEVEAMRLELLNMREDMHLDIAAFECDCSFCTDATAISFKGQSVAPVNRT